MYSPWVPGISEASCRRLPIPMMFLMVSLSLRAFFCSSALISLARFAKTRVVLIFVTVGSPFLSIQVPPKEGTWIEAVRLMGQRDPVPIGGLRIARIACRLRDRTIGCPQGGSRPWQKKNNPMSKQLGTGAKPHGLKSGFRLNSLRPSMIGVGFRHRYQIAARRSGNSPQSGSRPRSSVGNESPARVRATRGPMVGRNNLLPAVDRG